MLLTQYEQNYDNIGCAAAWARESLDKHRGDKREHLYTQCACQSRPGHSVLFAPCSYDPSVCCTAWHHWRQIRCWCCCRYDCAASHGREQLEAGKTYDELWNAAQLEMVRLGKMHGFMRM